MLWQGGQVVTLLRRRHPLCGPGVPHCAGCQEEAGARVVPQVPRVVVREVAATGLRRAPRQARREAWQPREVGDERVLPVGAVVEAGAGLEIDCSAGAGEGGEEEGGEDGGEEGREQQGGEKKEGGLSQKHFCVLVGGACFLCF